MKKIIINIISSLIIVLAAIKITELQGQQVNVMDIAILWTITVNLPILRK